MADLATILAAAGFPHDLVFDQAGESGRRSLLVHSSGLGSRQWLRLLGELDGRRLAVNLSGYAGGPAEGSGSAVAEDLAFLEAVLAAVDEPVDLIGHSYGGALCVWLALRQPHRVRRVALHEPVLWGILASSAPAVRRQVLGGEVQPLLNGDVPPGEEWMARFIGFWSGPLAWQVMNPSLRRGYLSVADKVYREVLELCAEETPAVAYGGLRAPALVTYGLRTPGPQRRVCELLAEALPLGRLVELPGGHMAPLTDAREFGETVCDFLQSDLGVTK